MRFQLLLVVIGCLAPAFLTAAEVYRFVDKNGVVHYTDKPPNKTAKPVELPPLQVIDPADQTELPDAAPAEDRAARSIGVSIASPAPEQVFRGDDRRLPVSVTLDQPLPQGHGLIYFLDGQARTSSATRQPSLVMEGVERGEHSVSVAVVNSEGREVARSAPVVVHVKPPTVENAERLQQERKERRNAQAQAGGGSN